MYEQTSNSRHGPSHSNAPNSSTPSAQKIPYRTSPRSIAGRGYDAPPPLPPPRNLPGIQAQHPTPSIRGDIHSGRGAGGIGTGSVSPESSLARGNWDRPKHIERQMSHSIESRRESFPTIWSPSGSDNYDMKSQSRPEFSYGSGFKDEGYSSLSGSSLIHRLVVYYWC